MKAFAITLIVCNCIIILCGIAAAIAGVQDTKRLKKEGIITPKAKSLVIAIIFISILLITNIIYISIK